jgi:hypothetical protein
MRKSQAEIDAWIRRQELRLGIDTGGKSPVKPLPVVTVYPGPLAMERLAHFGADRLIANNPAYDAQCARTDAMLAEILEGCALNAHPLPRSKSNHQIGGLGPRIRTND